MDDTSYFTLTSKVGRFVFPKHVKMSHAKLIRDSIVASEMGAIPSVPRISNPKFAARWFRDHVAGPIANTGLTFEWIPV
jgi:hypothetical protein